MKMEYDAAKRDRTLEKRGLDFEDARLVFASVHFSRTDDRHDYGEVRTITTGALNERPVVLVWTQRGDAVRIISMRVAHDDEREAYWRELDRSR